MASTEIARVTHVETAAERTAPDATEDDVLASAAAAALNLLAESILRGADYDAVIDGLKAAGADKAFARIFERAAERVMQDSDDPYDLDMRLRADNLSGAASEALRLFDWL
ncbi:hypothetical protein [Streptomyces ipomoeae]|uniref:hypothetical protein n=1 Tax=Streptomyces ipomoeae TaxID=103232 RepID=UPI00114746D2|nr:hypothetical protein [Streptomyces ipomoeae]TQE33031.1 hypothetical protein Sipo7851_21235 [Streptomyces ipomoeae]